MATRNKPVKSAPEAAEAAEAPAVKKAPKFAGKTAAAPATEKPAAKATKNKPAAAPVAEAAPRGRGREPLDGKFVIDMEAAGTRVKRGFTREYLDAAIAMQKSSKGRGFQLSELFASFPDKSRAQLMDCHYACSERGVYKAA